jgi:4-aminobutyrate aminotransferase/(S)-3-amino-2-methylpropionate transaminase
MAGERSRTVEQRLKDRNEVIPRAVRTATDLFVVRAEGHTLWDADGRAYTDLTGGIGVTTTGHRPVAVVKALKEQLDRYLHVCFMVYNYEPYIELARRLREVAPLPDGKSAFFNSGAEAVENAVKISRAYTGRPGIISFQNSFHGRTLLTLSLTGKYSPYKVGFEPFVPHVYQAPFAYCYRCPLGLEQPECGVACLEYIEDIFHSQAPPDKVSAILMEPIQGEGGFVVPPKEYVRGLREISDKFGIVLIDDEVQAGLGRTAKMFAIEHFGVQPDLVCTAKALGGGLPISGVTGRPAVMDAPVPGSIGGTFGGNPLACVAAIENLALIRKSLRGAADLGRQVRKRLEEMQESHALIGDVRGLGCMQAVELVKDRKAKTPAKDETKAIQKEARNRGLLLLTAGWHDNVIRLLPPINMPRPAMAKSLDTLDEALVAVEKGL